MKPGQVIVPFTFQDENGSPFSGLPATCYISKDGGDYVISTNLAVSLDNGDYILTVTAEERGDTFTRIKATAGIYTTIITITTDQDILTPLAVANANIDSILTDTQFIYKWIVGKLVKDTISPTQHDLILYDDDNTTILKVWRVDTPSGTRSAANNS